MGVSLTKDSIDLGIIVRDGDRAIKFYRDLLGFEYVATIPLPGGGSMHRLLCGNSVIKLVQPGETPSGKAAPGGPFEASGTRYWTISVSNLEDIVQQCKDAGAKIVWDVRDVRPGIRVAMVEDPEGNLVEFLDDQA